MRVGILGSGDVGKQLAKGFVELHHEVMIGTRDASKLTEFVAQQCNGKAKIGSFAETAKFGELVVVALLGKAAEEGLKQSGIENFKGKIVWDTMNPLDFSKGRPDVFVGTTDSLGEQVQRWIPEARVVKAFNIIGANCMFNPQFRDGKPDMFICGNDEAAKKTTSDLIAGFGFGTIDLGSIECSRYLEPMASAWISHAMKIKSWTHGFKMLHA